MNPTQFTTKAQAESVLALIGPSGGGGTLFIPEYAGPFQVPSNGDALFYHHIRLNNGFTCNAGLNLQNMLKYGNALALEFSIAEQKNEGRWIIG